VELKVEYVNIRTIKPYKRNAKTHPKEQIDQIKKSIQEFGNCDPIGVWHGEIVEGHGRYLALKELGCRVPFTRQRAKRPQIPRVLPHEPPTVVRRTSPRQKVASVFCHVIWG